jgi:hypothetical protein
MSGVNGLLWRRVLVICGLSAVAVTGPILDLYGRNPEVFVANRTSPWEIALFAVLVGLFVPALSFLLVWGLSLLGERPATIGYWAVVVLLSAAAGLVVARQVSSDDYLVAVLIGVVVIAGMVALHRWAHGFLVISAVALPAVVILFLTTSPASALVWQGEQVVDDGGVVGNPAPIVLIQLDEMPLASIMTEEGTVNEVLFPSFARLADEGTWYRNALSMSIATTQSVPSILSGIRGERGMSPSSVDHPDNLFTLVGDEYEMHVIEWVADLCPEDLCPDYAGRAPARFSSLLADVGVVYLHLTLPAPARESLPNIDNSWKGFLGQGTEESGIRVEIEGLPVPEASDRARWVDWLQRITNGIAAGGDRPVLSYAHLQAPHVPWVTNPSGTHYLRPEEYSEVEGVVGNGTWVDDPGPPLIGFQRHLYQVGMLDRMLGRLFEALDESGTWDDTMVIVVADHGASFVPGQHRRWPYEDNRDDLYRVPMFVKYPGQTSGSVVDEPAYGFDLLPTIVDALEIDTDWAFDGISLLDVAGTDRAHEPIWWCCSDEGAGTDLAVLFSQVERNHQWVPDQSSWLGVAGVGPDASLIGEDLGRLEVTTDADFRWYLDLGADLLGPDREPGITQTYLNGRLVLPPDITTDRLVVALNGTVAGMGILTRDSSDGASFQALVAEELIEAGPNAVEVLLPGPDGVWLSGESDDLSVERVTDEGRVLDIRPEGSRRLQVDRAALVGDEWVLRGWAADVNRKETPDTFYVFAGDQLLIWGPPNVDNRNVVRWFRSDALLRSGFEFEIPAASVPEGVGELMVVAEFGGQAIGDQARLTR